MRKVLGALLLLVGTSNAFLSTPCSLRLPRRDVTGWCPLKQSVPIPRLLSRHAPSSGTRLEAVSSEIAEILSEFGVPESKHEDFVAKLTPLLTGKGPTKSAQLDIEVVRGEGGGLGIDVDQDNVIKGNAGQPNLKVGDRIVAVDGEQLAGRPVAQVLTPGQERYTFSVMRGVESPRALEDKISLLAADEDMFMGANGLSAQDPTKNVKPFVTAAEQLEGLGGGVPEGKLKGFWKLVYTNDVTFAARGGASGLAAMPYCALAAHWQCYQDKEPTGQTVEVVANSNLGTHAIAALKGTWQLGPEEEGRGRGLKETYKRLEYAGSAQGAGTVEKEGTVTYVGATVRISRRASPQVVGKDGQVAEGEGVYVYLRKSGGDVQGQLQQWMERDVPGAKGGKGPRWENTGGGGGGGGESMLRD